jgi:hypothetical protein
MSEGKSRKKLRRRAPTFWNSLKLTGGRIPHKDQPADKKARVPPIKQNSAVPLERPVGPTAKEGLQAVDAGSAKDPEMGTTTTTTAAKVIRPRQQPHQRQTHRTVGMPAHIKSGGHSTTSSSAGLAFGASLM